MSPKNSRQSAAWIAALVCALLPAGTPAIAGLSQASTDGAATSAASLVTPITLDPATGHQVAVWSQFDGVSNKIAYARLVNGVWSDFHYLTFGRGQHTAPRTGVTRDGAFLFWVADGRRYLYAPIDLAGGRLHAAPRRVPIESGGLHLLPAAGGGIGTEGGSDVPVVTEECPPEDPDCEPSISAGEYDPRRRILTEGGSDVPVVSEKSPPGDTDCGLIDSGSGDQRRQILTEGGSDVPVVADAEALWSVTSRPACNLMILSFPAAEPGAFHLLRFEGGRIDRAGRVLLQRETGGLPPAAAAPLLDSSCF